MIAPSKSVDLTKEVLAWLEFREHQTPADFTPLVQVFLANPDAEAAASLVGRAFWTAKSPQLQFSRWLDKTGSVCCLPSELLPPE